MGLTCPLGISLFGPARKSSKLHWPSLFSQDGWILDVFMGRDEKRANIQLVQIVKCDALMESGGKKEEEGKEDQGRQNFARSRQANENPTLVLCSV